MEEDRRPFRRMVGCPVQLGRLAARRAENDRAALCGRIRGSVGVKTAAACGADARTSRMRFSVLTSEKGGAANMYAAAWRIPEGCRCRAVG